MKTTFRVRALSTWAISALWLSLLGGLLLGVSAGHAQPRQSSGADLGRGVLAVPSGEGDVFVSWRLLADDPGAVAFNVYRREGGDAMRLNEVPLTTTNFTDEEGGEDARYVVRPVEDGQEQAASPPSLSPSAYDLDPDGHPYLNVPLQTPQGYTPNDASIGDLDGDDEYEIVLHQIGRGRDNSQAGFTDPPIIEAYELDGTLLWRINLGINIREGAHYTQFIVYDFDEDGRAEIAMKTADGTTDGEGTVIGDAEADYRNDEGYILEGPEYLTMFDGETGAALSTTDYVPPRHPDTDFPSPGQIDAIWGDGYGNRVDRFLGAVAYLDGERPSLVMQRGYYTRMVLAAWDWDGEEFSMRWTFDSAEPGNGAYYGEGNHGLSVADVDEDGRDEVITGAAAIDDDGTGLYATGIGHGDALHVSDLDPTHAGMELFHIQEPVGNAGANFRDADSGEILWQKPTSSGDEGPGRGMAANVDPRYRGAENWVFGGGISGMFDVDGNLITPDQPGSANFAIWWDGDLQRELLNRNRIDDWNWEEERLERLLTARGSRSNNGSKATPALQADLFGDWREEVIWRAEDNQSLRIYSTTIPTPHRFVTLMQDHAYRMAVAWQNVGYNQPPHTSFYIGEDMNAPPPVEYGMSIDFGGADETSDYRLLALPGAENVPLDDVLDGEAGIGWTAFRQAEGEDELISQSEASEEFAFGPGKGVWVLATSNLFLSGDAAAPTLRADGTYAYPLRDGWNIISNPFQQSFAWEAVQEVNGVSQPLWAFDSSGYEQAGVLSSASEAAEAFYFYNQEGLGELVLPYTAEQSASATSERGPLASRAGKSESKKSEGEAPIWALSLKAEQKALGTDSPGPKELETASATVRVGAARDASEAIDRWDQFAPPGRFEPVSLRVLVERDGGEAPPAELAAEYRAPAAQETEQRFDLALRAPGGAEVAFRLGVAPDQQAILIRAATGERFSLAGEEAVAFVPAAEEESLTLVVGAQVESSKALPARSRLTGSYPNPFSQQATIAYDVATPSKVRLVVYDVLGRVVRTLVDERQGAGQKKAMLRASSLSSGVYVFRLQIADHVETGRLVCVQ